MMFKKKKKDLQIFKKYQNSATEGASYEALNNFMLKHKTFNLRCSTIWVFAGLHAMFIGTRDTY